MGEQGWTVLRNVFACHFLWSPMMSALKLYKHACHFCEAAECAALSVFDVLENFLARIQTANKAAAMAARGDNDQAKVQMLQGLRRTQRHSLPQLHRIFFK